MPSFRDPVARDRAWGQYLRRRGCAPVTRDIRPIPQPIRRAIYEARKALSQPVRC